MTMKWTAVLILAISWTKLNTASPVTGDCTDGSGIYLVDNSFPCSMLLDPSQPQNAVYGIYRSRVALCETGVHDCCNTCKQVQKQHTIETAHPATCEDVAGSLWLADAGYSCNYLLDKELPNSAMLGIYRARVTLCRRGVHQCCQACRQVFIQEGLTKVTKVKNEATTPAATTEATAGETTTIQTIVNIVPLNNTEQAKPEQAGGNTDTANTGSTDVTTPPEATKQIDNTDTTEQNKAKKEHTDCTDESFHLIGKTFECGLLLKPESPAYVHRHRLCSLQTTQCCLTCKQIQTTTEVIYNIMSADAPVPDTPVVPGEIVYSSVDGPQLATLEKRMHDKVEELQHEVHVLFGMFRKNKK